MQSVLWATGCRWKVSRSSSLTKMFSDRSSGFQACRPCNSGLAGGMSSSSSSRNGRWGSRTSWIQPGRLGWATDGWPTRLSSSIGWTTLRPVVTFCPMVALLWWCRCLRCCLLQSALGPSLRDLAGQAGPCCCCCGHGTTRPSGPSQHKSTRGGGTAAARHRRVNRRDGESWIHYSALLNVAQHMSGRWLHRYVKPQVTITRHRETCQRLRIRTPLY